MKILPPERPRRLTGPVRPDDRRHDYDDRDERETGSRHYHYHASGDPDERIRRDAVRDYLFERDRERTAHRRALGLTIFGIFVVVVLLGAFLSPNTTPIADQTQRAPTPSGQEKAVQVTSEYIDGKWVATARQVPVPGPEDAERHDDADIDTSSILDDDAPLLRSPAAFRQCAGYWVSPDGLAAFVDDRDVTMWFEYQVRANGSSAAQTVQGEPTTTGIRLVRPDGQPGMTFACQPDHMIVTLHRDDTTVTLPRVRANDLSAAVAAWEDTP